MAPMTIDIAENLGAQRLAAEKGRHRHRWTVDNPPWPAACACGALKDAGKTRKGRNARRLGNDFELDVAHALSSVFPDVRRVGQYGGPEDVSGRLIYVQCKKQAGLYPKGADRLLSETETHANADQYTAVAYAHPGHGHHRLIVMDLADFVNLIREVMGDDRA
jgi:hypothetical protein